MATYGKNKPSYDTEVYFEEIIRKIVMELYEERDKVYMTTTWLLVYI